MYKSSNYTPHASASLNPITNIAIQCSLKDVGVW